MFDEKKRPCLQGEEAIELWQQGKDAWNAWVENNRISDVDFTNVNFSEYSDGENHPISFEAFTFPNGTVSFKGATFGASDVYFVNTVFGAGDVHFSDALFGDGSVHFNNAAFGLGNVNFNGVNFGNGYTDFSSVTFGNGHVNFTGVTFGTGEVSFIGVTFGTGKINFSDALFGEGNVHFSDALFGNGKVFFRNITFGTGDVNFTRAIFGDENVFFDGATFGKGNVSFNEANFGNGNVNFTGVNFGKGNVYFNKASFGEGDVDFVSITFDVGVLSLESIQCKGRFNFTNMDNAPITSFRNSIFNNAVTISNVSFCGIVDLVNTKLTHQLSLHDITYSLPRETSRLGLKKAKNPKDSERLNRLKELAETNKHHKLALRCHADEHRAQRWQTMKKFESFLDMAFSGVCNYGQSIKCPSFFLLFSILIFTLIYTAQSDSLKIGTNYNHELLVFSAANSMPLLSSSRSAKENGIGQLFKKKNSFASVYFTMMIQSLVSFILIFLIGLGLRNRFRL